MFSNLSDDPHARNGFVFSVAGICCPSTITEYAPSRSDASPSSVEIKQRPIDVPRDCENAPLEMYPTTSARALTANTPIMLMDEAFSALDPLIRTDMQDLLLELQKELHKTIIFITHDLDEALKLADHLVILKDGFVVQQGEPQHILLNPSDPYIEDFVSDINRARVLRVRSIMTPLKGSKIPKGAHGEVDVDDTLESLIAKSEGDTSHTYVVTQEGSPVGTLGMKTLVRALVPRIASDSSARQY